MVSGGNATIIVADLDRAIRFYTEVLGFKLTNRFGDDWATVSAGEGLTIGIHPASRKYPKPGTKGATIPGIDVDRPMEEAVARRLARHNVPIKGSITRTVPAIFSDLDNPDGNEIYLWEKPHPALSELELAGSTAG